jgi:hypothetical protein
MLQRHPELKYADAVRNCLSKVGMQSTHVLCPENSRNDCSVRQKNNASAMNGKRESTFTPSSGMSVQRLALIVH